MSSGLPLARPTPAQLWIVTPPTLLAAMPVGAVTATESSPWRRRSSWMTYRRRKDLPVPAAPLKKTFSPRIARSAAERCSAVRESADTAAAAAEDEDDDEEEDDGAARSFWAAISRSISADVAALSENAAAAAGVYEAENVPELAAADEDAEDEDEDEDEAEDEDSAEAADPDDDADE